MNNENKINEKTFDISNGTGDIELEVQPILDFSAKPAIVTLTLP